MSLIEYKEVYGYFVSRDGIILSKKHGKPLVPCDNGRGYLIVHVTINGKSTSKTVHRMVAEAWIPNPDNLSDVNHKDCNRLNNHVDNLEWMTHGDNIKYSFNQEKRSATGENNARCTITEADVKSICALLASGLSAAQVRDKGFDYGRVKSIKRRQNWTHISKNYVW